MGRGGPGALNLLDRRLPIVGVSRQARVQEIAERQRHLELGLRLLRGPLTIDASDLPESERMAAVAAFQRDCEMGQVAAASVVADLNELLSLLA